MNDNKQKILGDERRKLILSQLKESEQPLSGSKLAEMTNVSRQVIVQDISLLKASGEPIIATSRGYMYVHDNESEKVERVVAVCHKVEDTAFELYTFVDKGVTIKNVVVEHPIYGDLTGSLMIHSRRDADMFLKKMEETDATLLSRLTEGVHLHTVEADTESQIDEAVEILHDAGYLLD